MRGIPKIVLKRMSPLLSAKWANGKGLNNAGICVRHHFGTEAWQIVTSELDGS
jgi:hypothetical protein